MVTNPTEYVLELAKQQDALCHLGVLRCCGASNQLNLQLLSRHLGW
jgi:hypothetical protein